jgi:osmotically-inducible protein OsmY
VLKDRDVDFEVKGGVVTIKGDVRTSAEREQAEQMVRSAGESKDIVNALEVKPGDS